MQIRSQALLRLALVSSFTALAPAAFAPAAFASTVSAQLAVYDRSALAAIPGRYAVLLDTDAAAQAEFHAQIGELRRARATTALAQRIEARRAELLPRQAELAAFASSRGAHVVEQGWLLDLVIVEHVSPELHDELRARADVVALQPIERRAPALATALDAAHHDAYAAHALSIGGVPLEGSGQAIAILDTGLDLHVGGLNRPHAAFYADGDPLNLSGGGIAGSRVDAAQFVSYGGHTTSAEDVHGHGTRMASCAAGAAWTTYPDVGDGTAPSAHLRIFKIADDSPQYFGLTTADGLFSMLQKVVQQPDVFVANLSYDGWKDPSYFINPSLDAVVLGGISVTVSAGNYGSFLEYAHGCFNPLVVGGSEETSYSPATSTFPSAVGPLSDGRRYPHVLAQGVNVTCANKDDEISAIDSNGCSPGAAITAGALALLHQTDPTLTPGEAKALLLNTTAATFGNPNAAGWGYMKVLAAVQQAQAGRVVRETLQQGAIKRYPVTLTPGVENVFTLTWERTNTALSLAGGPGFVADLDLEFVNTAGITLASSASSVDLVEQLRLTPISPLQGEVRVIATFAATGSKATSYALAGVSSVAIDDGAGCSGGAIAIAAVTPAVVPSLADGPNTVTIQGCNLVPLPTLKLNGVPTSVQFKNPSLHALTFDLPPLGALGPLAIELTNANGTASVTASVVAPQPLIRFGATAATATTFVKGVNYQPYVGGTPGDFALVAISGTLSPTQLPGIVDLAIGNGFNDLYLLTTQGVPPKGWFQPLYKFAVGLPALQPVHFQAAFYSTATGLLPLSTSPVTSGVVL